jgi:hypothetical protein
MASWSLQPSSCTLQVHHYCIDHCSHVSRHCVPSPLCYAPETRCRHRWTLYICLIHIVVIFFDTGMDLLLQIGISHLCIIKSLLPMFISTSIILNEFMLDQMWSQHIIYMISLFILAMFARTTKIPSKVVQHIFLHEIDKCIYPFDRIIAKAWPIHPTLIRRHLHTYKITNYVLDEIHLMTSFTFLL